MKNFKNFLVVFFLFAYSLCFSQNKPIEKLKLAFGNERVKYLSVHFPDSLAYYEFVVENGFRISHKKYLKEEEYTQALPIDLPENILKNNIPQPQLINIFALPVSFHPTKNMYYRINKTDYFLILRSKDYLTKKFNSKPK